MDPTFWAGLLLLGKIQSIGELPAKFPGFVNRNRVNRNQVQNFRQAKLGSNLVVQSSRYHQSKSLGEIYKMGLFSAFFIFSTLDFAFLADFKGGADFVNRLNRFAHEPI